MTTKNMFAILCAAGMIGGAFAEEEKKPAPEQAELQSEKDDPRIVSAEVSIAYESHHISYGLIDTRAPIVTPAGSLTFFDLITFNASFVFDTTRYSRKVGIGNQRWQCWEHNAEAAIAHTFSAEDYEWLPTSIRAGVEYTYEYHPRRAKSKTGGVNGNPDTQFITAYALLPDLWLVPKFTYERDIVRDDGTYLNFELSHEFALLDGATEDADPLLALELSAAQGYGNSPRIESYLGIDRNALMDTTLKATLTWNICEHFALEGYVGFMDFWFDRHVRDASRWYEPGLSGSTHSDSSWHVIWGVTATASF